jgi:hypothetical protein
MIQEMMNEPRIERVEGTIQSVGPNGVVTLEDDIRLSIPKKVRVPKDQLKPGAVIVAEYEQRGSQKVATSVEIKS